jgi:hypothetical protein
MNNFTRRTFISGSVALGLGGRIRPGFALTEERPLLLHLFANGGWDVASFCDPKINVTQKTNTWAELSSIQNAGVIPYAPVAENTEFFTRHNEKLLVINGVNAKTNVHSAGRLTSLTGRSTNGFPSICSLYAATHGKHLAMPLLVGNSFETGGIIAPTQINGGLIKLLKTPQITDKNYISNAQLKIIERALNNNIQSTHEDPSKSLYLSAVQGEQTHFAKTIEFYQSLTMGSLPESPITDDIKFALSAFAAGASLACDHSIAGFDTHENHDKNMAGPLTQITRAANAAWQFAEQLNIADRLIVIMSSEFGRAPFYNDVAGKDHWPFSSVLIMKKNAPWGNRVLGKTDDDLIGIAQNTYTSLPSGKLLEMGHIHQSLRKYLAINDSLAATYPLEKSVLPIF